MMEPIEPWVLLLYFNWFIMKINQMENHFSVFTPECF